MNIIDDKDLLPKTIEALRKSLEDKQKSRRDVRDLFSSDMSDVKEKVHLVVALVRIPKIPLDGKVKTFSIRSRVPNCFVDETSNVLLLTRDLEDFTEPKDDRQKSVDAFRSLLEGHKILNLVTEIMPVAKLKYDYKDFEARRKLARRFDIVLCDKKVFALAPKLLGKAFYRSRKNAIRVNLAVSNLKKEIHRALSSSYLHMGLSGGCARAQVGRLSQTNEEISANIRATVDKWAKKIPGGWKNVRSICVKSDTSPSLPIFRSTVLANELDKVKHPLERKDKTIAMDNITTLPDHFKVLVKRSSQIRLINKKNNTEVDISQFRV